MGGAIIGIYAYEITGSLPNTQIVAVNVMQSGPDIVITYRGGTAPLYSLAVIAPNSTPFYTVSVVGALSTTGTPVTPDAGAVMVLSGAATSGQDHVGVVGHFTDGSNQVISDVFV